MGFDFVCASIIAKWQAWKKTKKVKKMTKASKSTVYETMMLLFKMKIGETVPSTRWCDILIPTDCTIVHYATAR